MSSTGLGEARARAVRRAGRGLARAGHAGVGVLRALWGRTGVVGMVAGIVILGWWVSAYKIELIRPLKTIGHADSVAYALMGRSIAHGHGLDADHISFFFIPYPREITHREDHWPPFMGFAIAPFFLLLGEEAWVAKLAPILIGSILLPLATAMLGWVYSRRSYVGFVAGVLMMCQLSMFTQSLTTLSDVAAAMLVTAFLAALLATRRHPRMHVAAGALAVMAYFAKGSLLLLVGLYPVLAMLVGGIVVLGRRWMWVGIGTMAVLLAPWFIGNWWQYGNPLHCTQNYVSGYYGVAVGEGGGWDEYTYHVYWGRDLPKTSDRWKDPQFYDLATRRNRTDFACMALLGPESEAGAWDDLGEWGGWIRDWIYGSGPGGGGPRGGGLRWSGQPVGLRPVEQWHEPATELCSVAAGLFVCALLLGIVPMVFGRLLWRHVWTGEKRFDTASVAGITPPAHPAHPAHAAPLPLIFPTLAILLVLISQWYFISYYWQPLFRFAFIFLPSIAVIGCTGVGRLLEMPSGILVSLARCVWWWMPRPRGPRGRSETGTGMDPPRIWPSDWLERWHWPVTLLMVTATVWWVGRHGEELKAYQSQHAAMYSYPYRDAGQYYPYPAAGEWIKKNLPDAIIMCRNAWELRFYSAQTNKTVSVPYTSDLGEVFAIARYYRVTHYLHDPDPSVRNIFGVYGERPGLKRVEETPPGVELYELDYDKLPNRPATTQPAG